MTAHGIAPALSTLALAAAGFLALAVPGTAHAAKLCPINSSVFVNEMCKETPTNASCCACPSGTSYTSVSAGYRQCKDTPTNLSQVVANGQSVTFQNVGTGDFVVLKPDPRGGGALEGGSAAESWRIYQGSGAASLNVEVKRAPVDGFNWSNYDNRDDAKAFIAWNHAKRQPSATSPTPPHDWTVEDQGGGRVLIRHASGEVMELMPDLRLHIRGSEGGKIITRAHAAGNEHQLWVVKPAS